MGRAVLVLLGALLSAGAAAASIELPGYTTHAGVDITGA
jgi:hypothetical protein